VGEEELMVRALVVWVVLMLAEIVHGTLREFYLKPLIGDFRARQVAVFTGSCLLFGITCWLVRWMRAEGRLLLVGTAWVVLTVAFEVGAGRWLAGRSWEDVGADFALSRGGLLPLGLVVLWLSPLVAARLRR
jgi:hypothetical protein